MRRDFNEVIAEEGSVNLAEVDIPADIRAMGRPRGVPPEALLKVLRARINRGTARVGHIRALDLSRLQEIPRNGRRRRLAQKPSALTADVLDI